MPHFGAGRKTGSFDSGVQHLVAAVLVSPDFQFRAVGDRLKADTTVIRLKANAGRTPSAVARSKEIAVLLPPAGRISR